MSCSNFPGYPATLLSGMVFTISYPGIPVEISYLPKANGIHPTAMPYVVFTKKPKLVLFLTNIRSTYYSSQVHLKVKNKTRTNEMAQRVGIPASETDKLGLVLNAHSRRELIPIGCPLTSTCVPWHLCTYTHMLRHIVNKLVKKTHCGCSNSVR